ncbi:MAG: LptE family protein [Acidobacteriota bacterium]
MKRKVISVLVVCAALSQLGCGYGLVGRTSNLPEDIQKIYVDPLENRTTRTQVNLYLTQAIVDELVTRRRFEIVSSASSADAVLQGAVTSYIVRPVQFGPDGRATDYQVIIRCDMEFKRQDGGEVIWDRPQYLFRDDYQLEIGTEGVVFDPENLLIQGDLAQRFAQTLIIDLLEGF